MAVPTDYLDPAELGRRLQILPPSGSPLVGVRLARDEETGVTWWVRAGHGAGQVQLEVVAGVLYRAADYAASTWRLVELDSGLGVAQEARVAWSAASDDDLEDGRAVDLWLGNIGGAKAARRRLLPVPGPRVLRLDLAHTLGWDGLGLRRSGAGWPEVPRLAALRLDTSALRGVTVDELDEALDVARLGGERRASLRLVLEGRLEALLAGR